MKVKPIDAHMSVCLLGSDARDHLSPSDKHSYQHKNPMRWYKLTGEHDTENIQYDETDLKTETISCTYECLSSRVRRVCPGETLKFFPLGQTLIFTLK